MGKYYAYIGSWVSIRVQEAYRGITVAEYDSDTGNLTPLVHVLDDLNCSMLTYDKRRQVLYTGNEMPQTSAGPGGRAIALRVDLKSGDLEKISDVSSFGMNPSYVAYDPLGEFLVLTNHSMGHTILKTVQDENGEYHLIQEYDETAGVLYELNPDGSIGKVCDIFRHTGHGAKPEQTNPHLHSARFTPDGRFVFICDKGTDGYYIYRLDRENKKMTLSGRLDSFPGAAPRYSVLHPFLPVVYFNNEAERLLTMVRYDEEGKLEKVNDFSTVLPECLPSDDRSPMQSDLIISADGRCIYNLVRADNVISVFSVDETGRPELIQNAPAAGTGQERGLTISPDGKYLFLCPTTEPVIYRYRIAEGGTLSDKQKVLEDVAPGSMIFIEAE